MSTEIIVLILQFIPLQTLLTRVNRVCWKIHDIIENSPILWKDINFDYHICIRCDDLRRLLIYSRIAQSIHLPHSTCESSSPDIDSVLTSSKFDSLIWFLARHQYLPCASCTTPQILNLSTFQSASVYKSPTLLH